MPENFERGPEDFPPNEKDLFGLDEIISEMEDRSDTAKFDITEHVITSNRFLQALINGTDFPQEEAEKMLSPGREVLIAFKEAKENGYAAAMRVLEPVQDQLEELMGNRLIEIERIILLYSSRSDIAQEGNFESNNGDNNID